MYSEVCRGVRACASWVSIMFPSVNKKNTEYCWIQVKCGNYSMVVKIIHIVYIENAAVSVLCEIHCY